MEKPTVENKVKEIAEAMGLTYLCESWFRANQAFDRFRRQGDRRRGGAQGPQAHYPHGRQRGYPPDAPEP